MEEQAIADGFANLKDGSAYDNLYAAALCREHADWLIGMNGSRYFSVLYERALSVGRVMSPTMCFLVQREKEITGFVKETFYTVDLDCGGFSASSDRISSLKDARALEQACGTQGEALVVTVRREDKSSRPPKLYDLTALQRDANRLYGYTANQTLDYMQSLYEKKLATYPRTDSRYLTQDAGAGVPALIQALTPAPPFASELDLAIQPAQVINDSKVSDHHAIIPTLEAAKVDLTALPTGERNVLHLVAARLFCAVGLPHRYAETTVMLACADRDFHAKGRVVTDAGWKVIEKAHLSTIRDKPKEEKVTELPKLVEQQVLRPVHAALHKGFTSPPKRYTEDTLLAAMETAGSEDFAEIPDVERKGLGTSATRASTIEKLLEKQLAKREKSSENNKTSYLIPTQKGVLLAGVLPEILTSAKLTAEWEAKLADIAHGNGDSATFMAGIEDMARQLVASKKTPDSNPFPVEKGKHEPVGDCPWCGKPVFETDKGFCCSGYHDTPACGFALWKDDRFFAASKKKLTRPVATALLKKGSADLTGLFSARTGKTYSATVVLTTQAGKEGKLRPHFELTFPTRKGKQHG
ncbi:DNA topoisomerase [Ethanoligenens sp.]|uniref:DNA topoisomerase n=1 Tax=Ethanoligenens sp. TaxID=2099655 RepID=UPI0039ED0510